ncbi:MAG: dienelactone hydrolase family protein, partial [Burkholderiaceae bacterium]|nr:dienelactone hydrolase family protein [Burkholderiaceae bacterium]
ARALLASILATTLALPATLLAQPLEKTTLRRGATEVPIEIARPAGDGPWPAVFYLHARRGFEDVDREHMRALARDGFLVLAPDWVSSQMLERWPDRHVPETEDDVAAAFAMLLAHPHACRQPVGVVAKSRGPYFAIRLAAQRPADVAAIVSYYGHFQNPNAPEPQQLFQVAPEVMQITAPVLMLIGDADFELRRIVNGRAFYALWERGVPVSMQMYPMARRAFDFRADQTPEEKIATRHAAAAERAWLRQHMKLDAPGRCSATR